MARDLTTNKEKVCVKCRRIKPANDFRDNSLFLGGKHPMCEQCLIPGLVKDEARRS